MRFQRAVSLNHLVRILLALVLLSGCKVTAEDIEEWKGTVKGPQKICAVIGSDRYPIELRAQAAFALVELDREIDVGRGEQAGVIVLQQTLQRIENEEVRKDIVDAMVDRVIALMDNTDRPQTDEPVDPNFTGPPMHQIRAKDAAYILANPNMSRRETRFRLIDSIVDWYVDDFNQRNLTGRFTAQQVIRALGSRAASKLVDALNARLPEQTLHQITELIAQLGNAETRRAAGDRIVAVEREMEGTEFNEWIQGEIRTRLQGRSEEISDERLRQSATENQARMLTGALLAMKTIASEPVVGERLVEIAEDTNAPTVRRTQALLALEGNPPASALSLIASLATTRTLDPGLRTAAFDRLTDLRNRDALTHLWPLIELAATTAAETRERGMATDVGLIISGPEGVSEVLSRLPSDRSPYYSSQELNGYGLAIAQMNPAPMELMRGLLGSPNWWIRIVALRFLQHGGSEEDIARMEGLASDSAATNGPDWLQLNTVGKVSEHALEQLRTRLAEEASRQPETEAEAEGEPEQEEATDSGGET